MRTVGTALVGCGKVGQTHAQAYKSLEETNFVAVCDTVDPARADAFASKYEVKAYSDLDALLQDPEVEMVSIATPHPSHPEVAVAAARAGKHVLMEKPMAVDLKGCDDAIAAAKKAGIKLGLVSQRRFYEPVQRVKEAIDAGKVGKPILCTVTVLGWRDHSYYKLDPWHGKWATEGGGVLLSQTSHQLDLFQWFMGPIDEIYGYWGTLNHPTIEVDDTAIAVMRFKNGALGVITVSNSQNPGLYGNIHVHGENGASIGVQTDGSSMFISGVTENVEPPVNDIWTVPGEEHLLERWQAEDRERASEIDVMAHYHKLHIRDFLHAIIDDREPLVPGLEGRRHVEVAVAIYRSQRDRRPVKFPPDAVEGSEKFDGRLA